MNAPALHPNLLAADMAIEIADEASVRSIELIARRAPSNYPLGVWDVSSPDPAECTGAQSLEGMQEEMQRAVRYLDLRGLLVRPIAGCPQYVSFVREA